MINLPLLNQSYQSAFSLHWRHNDHDGVSNHQPHGCLLNRLFRRWSKKTSKLRVTGLCVGNSPGPVNSPHKGPVTWKMFLFDDVIMCKQGSNVSWGFRYAFHLALVRCSDGFRSQKTSNAELWCFFVVNLKRLLIHESGCLWFETPLALMRRYCTYIDICRRGRIILHDWRYKTTFSSIISTAFYLCREELIAGSHARQYRNQQLNYCYFGWCEINSLRPRLKRRPLADDIFKYIFLNENEWVLPRISLKFVPKARINNIPALV